MAYLATEAQKIERKEKRAAIAKKAHELQEAGTVRDVAFSLSGKAYSGVNQCMIAAQNGPAGVYGGFRSWLMQGRKVKKGGKGVIIYAPIIKKTDKKEEGEKVAMTTAHVFHVDQTEPVNACECQKEGKEYGGCIVCGPYDQSKK